MLAKTNSAPGNKKLFLNNSMTSSVMNDYLVFVVPDDFIRSTPIPSQRHKSLLLLFV